MGLIGPTDYSGYFPCISKPGIKHYQSSHWYNIMVVYVFFPTENIGFCDAISFAVMSG